MATTSSNAKPKNWWMYHGDQEHSGYINDSNINSGNVDTLEVLASLPLDGPVVSVPAIVDGIVYVGVANSHKAKSSNGGTFYKIDIRTGKILNSHTWSLDADELGDSHGFYGMGCTPAVINKMVYFSGFDGRVYCLHQEDLSLNWKINLREADPAYGQPITNMKGTVKDPVPPDTKKTFSPPAGWSSPLVVQQSIDGVEKTYIYVGIGEGENPYLYSFIFCLDGDTGHVVWIFCTNQFEKGRDNNVNELPAEVIKGELPPGYTLYNGNPVTKGSSIWSSMAYASDCNQIYACTGNPKPDSTLPSPGYSNGMITLKADTGAFVASFQPPVMSSYRPSDLDIDIGASPTVFERPDIYNALPGTNPSIAKKVVGIGAKNGGYFVLDASNLNLLNWRQLLPYYNNGLQIPTVDPHSPSLQANPRVTNAESNATMAENYHGTYSCAAIDPVSQSLFIGLGGSNYNSVAPGIDYETTPFMRAFNMEALNDIWPFDDSDPKRYAKSSPPMYTNPGECGLSSPAVVNDVVFCSTSHISLYAFKVSDGTHLWGSNLGSQTEGYNGGYGYCMGPAVWGDYVVAGALILGSTGGVLNIYKLPEN